MYIKKYNHLHSFVFTQISHPDPQPQIPLRDGFKCIMWLVIQDIPVLDGHATWLFLLCNPCVKCATQYSDQSGNAHV